MVRTLLLFISLSLLLTISRAQFAQLGQTIHGQVIDDRIGYDLSLNHSGTRLAVGIPFKSGNGSGQVNVYENIGGSWVLLGDSIKGLAGGESSGWAVALNAAGDRVAISSPYFSGGGNSRIGRVRIFEFDGFSWAQLGADIVGEGDRDLSGWSLDFNAAGDRVVIGARLNDGNGSNSGHARIYGFNNGSWTQVGQDIDGEFGNDRAGIKVAINNLGNIIATSSTRNGSSRGHVQLFQFTGINWTQLGTDIDGANGGDNAGEDIDLNGAGNRIAVGAKRNSDSTGLSTGHVRVFEYDSTSSDWLLMGDELRGEGSGDFFGLAVSLNDAGNRILVGGKLNDGNGSNAGHIRVFDYDGTAWVQLGNDLDGQGIDYNFGKSVTMDSTGLVFAGAANLANSVVTLGGQVIIYEECPDRDGDGYKDISCGGTDCNDQDSIIYPGAAEICDGRDNDCDGLVDNQDPDFVDNAAPIAVCQPTTVYLNANGNAPVSYLDIDAGSSDACSSVNYLLNIQTLDCAHLGINPVILQVTDSFNNSASCNTTITVLDTLTPVANCQDIIAYLDGNGSLSIDPSDINVGTLATCRISSSSVSHSSFDCTQVGVNQTSLTLGYSSGSTVSCQAWVTVRDSVAPMAICQNMSVILDSLGNGAITPTQIDAGSYDVCGIASSSLSTSSFDCSHVGTNISILTIRDQNNNRASCQAQITVIDTTIPQAVCRDLTVYLDSQGRASIGASDVDAGSIDLCGIYERSLSDYQFECTQIAGASTFLTVRDKMGNTSSCQSTITVIDSIAPTAVCKPARVFLDASGSVRINPKEVDGGSFDACGIAYSSVFPNSFSCDQIGTYSVRLTLSDSHKHVSSCQTSVIVVDTVAPTAICQDITLYLDAQGTASISVKEIDGGSFDACSITSRRLSRTTFGCSRIRTNTTELILTDTHGNIASCQAVVSLMDTLAPTSFCQPTKVFIGPNGTATVAPYMVDRGSFDACGISQMSVSPASFICQSLGNNPLELTVVDNAGNSSRCRTFINVSDTSRQAPICNQDLREAQPGSAWKKPDFMIFPNPSSGLFKLKSSASLQGNWKFYLSDPLGRTILTGKLLGDETVFNLRDLPSGPYHLMITRTEGKTYLRKIVKR